MKHPRPRGSQAHPFGLGLAEHAELLLLELLGVGRNIFLPLLWEAGVPTLKWYSRWKIDVAGGRHEQVALPMFDGMSAGDAALHRAGRRKDRRRNRPALGGFHGPLSWNG